MRLTLTPLEPICYEVLSLEHFKKHLRTNEEDNDALLKDLINSAGLWVEMTLGKSLLTRTYKASCPVKAGVPRIVLPGGPVQEILDLYQGDFQGKSYGVIENFEVDNDILTFETRRDGWAHLTYRCGYADRARDLPPPLIQAVLMAATSLYECTSSGVLPDRTALLALLEPFRARRLG